MRAEFSRFFLVFVSIWSSYGLCQPSAEKFESAYASYLAGKSVDIPLQKIETLDYLFFAGFGGEKFKPFAWFGRGYFDAFRHDFLDQGVELAQVPPTYYPPSHLGIWENADGFIASALAERFRQTGRKQVLFGHSKGAAELFAFAITHPEFIEKNVEAIFLMSGAIQGSALANLVTFQKTSKVALPLAIVSSAVALAVSPYIHFFCRSGAQSLCVPTTQRKLAERMQKDSSSLRLVLSKSLFVQTSVKGWDRAPAVWLPDAFLSAEAREPSDGIVVLSAQLPPAGFTESDQLQKVHLDGVNHFYPCPKLLSMFYFSRVPQAISRAALAAL